MATSPKVLLNNPVVTSQVFEHEEVVRILDAYERFFGDFEGVKLAISRLRQVRRTMLATEDQAIDIGIAMEVLMTHQNPIHQEITYRISNRAAWLLGRSIDERIAVANLVKVLYALRSDVVHSGLIKHNKRLGGKKNICV